MTSPETKHESPIVVIGALIANLGIAIAKFAAAFLTGSSAMLSEGIHSLVDTANEGVLLVGVRQSRMPADDLHQFGHGKVIYFWTLVVAVLIFAIGGGVAIYEGITHLFEPHPVEDALASYVVLAVSFVLEAVSSYIGVRELTSKQTGTSLWRAVLETKDASILAVLAENAAAMIGLVIAFVGIVLTQATGDPRFDAIASLAVGAVLVSVAIFLAAESRALIAGESLNGPLLDRSRELIRSDPAVVSLESLRTMHLGPDHVVMTARVRFSPAHDAGTAAVIARLKQKLADADPLLSDVTIEPVA